MVHRSKVVVVLFAVAILLMLGAPAAADGGGFGRLVGAWQTETTIDGSPDAVPGLITFNRGGTLIASGSNLSSGTAHGDWKGPALGPSRRPTSRSSTALTVRSP